MPSRVLWAKFVKEGRTISIEIEGPWWPGGPMFTVEGPTDENENHEAYNTLKNELRMRGWKEVEDLK